RPALPASPSLITTLLPVRDRRPSCKTERSLLDAQPAASAATTSAIATPGRVLEVSDWIQRIAASPDPTLDSSASERERHEDREGALGARLEIEALVGIEVPAVEARQQARAFPCERLVMPCRDDDHRRPLIGVEHAQGDNPEVVIGCLVTETRKQVGT